MKKTKIGIVGLGFVGGAVKNWFKRNSDKYDIYLYDKYKKIGSPEEINKANVIFVAVPTPFNENGYDDSAIRETLNIINNGKTVVIKSTVLPGSIDSFQSQHPKKIILFNPEFLRAKTANKDFVKPDRQIIGFAGPKGKKIAPSILKILPKAPFARVVKAKEAEMIKYFGNAYLATRVVFANQIYDLCEKLKGVDYDVVKDCVVQDKRIGDSHFEIFHEGYRGYGGGCFPKDVRAILQLGKKMRVDLGLIGAAYEINNRLINPNGKTRKIQNYFKESVDLKRSFLIEDNFLQPINAMIKMIQDCLASDNKILIAGNGGSAAEAQHFAAELVCTFMRKDRRGYPAIALNANTSVLTAWANDFEYKTVFARQVEALGRKSDVFIGISTSGNSANIIEACKTAKKSGLKTIGFLGNSGGLSKDLFDVSLIVPSNSTPRIQEVHTLLTHIICEEIEKIM
ncbi:MAG: SIS domain-containing protein [Candidatus Liptonbacteria bacterium]|nr:SIS domain-containing protein [Candidatus Liptonbacteria bacterium]